MNIVQVIYEKMIIALLFIIFRGQNELKSSATTKKEEAKL